MLFWMLYTIGVACITALACLAIERAVLSLGMPVRFVWLAGVIVAIGVTTLSILSRDFAYAGTSSINAMSVDAPEQRVVSVAGGVSSIGAPTELIDTFLSGIWLLSSLISAMALIIVAVRTSTATARAARRRIAGTSVLVTENTGPALVGVLHYDIVVPQWVTGLPADQQMLILEHERQHARVFDPALIWISASAIVAFPWNPALWFMLRRLRTAIELDCDRRVLDRYPDAPRYAALLLDVAERAASFPALAAALSESTSQLQRRITTIVDETRPFRPIAAMGTAAAIFLLFTAAIRFPVQSFPVGIDGGDAKAPADTSRANLSLGEQAEDDARRFYPAAFDPTRSPGSSVIGLLYDESGKVVHHSRLAIPDDNEILSPYLPALFPDGSHDVAPYRMILRADGSAGARHIDVVAVWQHMPDSTRRTPVYYEYQVLKSATQIEGTGSPVYPAELRAARVQGQVIGQFVVNEKGLVRPRTFKALSTTNEAFVAAVVAALPKMRFVPAEKDARKVQQIVQQAFIFRVE